LARRTSFITALIRSSNWPRYFVPATIMARSSTTMRRSCSISGTSPSTIFWARPSTIAVLPTPASPSSTGLFFCGGRESAPRVRSRARGPMTGSSLLARANSVRSRPKLSSAGVLLLPPLASPAGAPPPPGASSALGARAEQVEHLFADLFELEAEVHQHLGRHAVLLAEQAEQQVLGADVVVVEVAGLFDRVFDHLLGPRGLRQLAHGDHVGAALDELLDLQADLAQVDVEVLQHVGPDARSFLDQAEQDVLGADVFVVEPLGLPGWPGPSPCGHGR
jgi:hypothetical protein